MQRWKLGLETGRTAHPLPTMIEFSRRGPDEGVDFGSIAPTLVAEYRLTPFMASHYGVATALAQKVGALATPEKALVDFLYLRPARSQLFRALPEIERPRRFSARRARAMVDRIGSSRRRAMVRRSLDRILRTALTPA